MSQRTRVDRNRAGGHPTYPSKHRIGDRNERLEKNDRADTRSLQQHRGRSEDRAARGDDDRKSLGRGDRREPTGTSPQRQQTRSLDKGARDEDRRSLGRERGAGRDEDRRSLGRERGAGRDEDRRSLGRERGAGRDEDQRSLGRDRGAGRDEDRKSLGPQRGRSPERDRRDEDRRSLGRERGAGRDEDRKSLGPQRGRSPERDRRDEDRRSLGPQRGRSLERDRRGEEPTSVMVSQRKGRSLDRGAGGGGGGEEGGMSLVKQSTLLNHHVAIEDSVDIDRVWPDLEFLFQDHEIQDIQSRPGKNGKMQKLLDVLINKDDEAFDVLVDALQPEYEWLALRLQRGLKDEERRIHKVGKGIRRKIALAMLTARVSDRQKDFILDRVSAVVETEISEKVNRVSVPDHRAAAQLDREHRQLRDLIQYEVDPLLHGEDPSQPGRHDVNNDDILASLQSKLEELRGIQRCYAAMNLGTSTVPTLPSLLLEKIEEVKLRIKTLQKEKQAVQEEAQALSLTVQDQQRSLSRLEQHNRNLELENNNLESERQQLEHSARKYQEEKKDLEKNWQRVTEENRDLVSEIQQTHNKMSSLSQRTKSLDYHNSKLVRDNLKLTAANSQLRKEARNSGAHLLVAVRSENKRLASDQMHLKKDLHKMESERRHWAIRSQKLEMENRNLRDQKVRLAKDKKKNVAQNKALKAEAQRLALGKYSPLPPIGESPDYPDADELSNRSLTISTTSRHAGGRRLRHSDSYVVKTYQTRIPWNKHKDDDPNKPRKDPNQPDGEEDKGDGDGGEKRKPGYMKPTNSSKGHEYLEDEGRGDPCPKRTVAT